MLDDRGAVTQNDVPAVVAVWELCNRQARDQRGAVGAGGSSEEPGAGLRARQ